VGGRRSGWEPPVGAGDGGGGGGGPPRKPREEQECVDGPRRAYRSLAYLSSGREIGSPPGQVSSSQNLMHEMFHKIAATHRTVSLRYLSSWVMCIDKNSVSKTKRKL
jgi:hypothetical protein